MIRIISAALAAALILASCDTLGFSDNKQKTDSKQKADSNQRTDAMNSAGTVQIISPLPSTPADPAAIVHMAIRGDSLGITLRYGGGCKTHEFQLVTEGSVMESYPPQIGLSVLHNANNDLCRALETKEIWFDISPLKALASDATGHGILILHVTEPGATPPNRSTIRYEF